MVKKERPASLEDPGEIRTILGEDTHFNGVLSFEGAVRIDGKLEGEIISQGVLFVGEKSVIQADIKVDSIIIGGKVCGNIIVTNRLELLADAEIYGNIQTPILKIEEGAVLQGTCDMRKDNQSTKSISYINAKEPEIVMEHPLEMEEIVKDKVAS